MRGEAGTRERAQPRAQRTVGPQGARTLFIGGTPSPLSSWPVPPYPGEGREPYFSVEKINAGAGAKREHLGSALGVSVEWRARGRRRCSSTQVGRPCPAPARRTERVSEGLCLPDSVLHS